LQRFQARPAFLESLARDVFEIRVGAVAFGDRELRERLLYRIEFDLASLGDVPGSIQGIGNLAEQPHHFFARFEIELGDREPHAVRIGHGLAGLDAQENFVRAGVVLAQIVRIVRRD